MSSVGVETSLLTLDWVIMPSVWLERSDEVGQEGRKEADLGRWGKLTYRKDEDDLINQSVIQALVNLFLHSSFISFVRAFMS